jgi:hypothetical protein
LSDKQEERQTHLFYCLYELNYHIDLILNLDFSPDSHNKEWVEALDSWGHSFSFKKFLENLVKFMEELQNDQEFSKKCEKFISEWNKDREKKEYMFNTWFDALKRIVCSKVKITKTIGADEDGKWKHVLDPELNLDKFDCSKFMKPVSFTVGLRLKEIIDKESDFGNKLYGVIDNFNKEKSSKVSIDILEPDFDNEREEFLLTRNARKA